MDCHKCEYSESLPGDAHLACTHPKVADEATDSVAGLMAVLAGVGRAHPIISDISGELGIETNPHGVKNGWCNWPWNFDPVWIKNCEGFISKKA